MGKTLLVIGAGPAQLPAIRRATELGYRVCASDRDPSAPGFAACAASAVLDVTDGGGNLAWAREIGADGVTSYATDAALPAVLHVREVLGLPGTGRRAVEAGLDKLAQREAMARAGIPQPDFQAGADLAVAESCFRAWGGAMVVKPRSGSGSRGVSRVRVPEAIAGAIAGASASGRDGGWLCERLVEGRELSVETFSLGGAHRILAVGERRFDPGMFAVASEIVYPAELSAAEGEAVEQIALGALDALRVDHAPGHIEIMLGPEGPRVIEVGVRGGGFFIFSTIVREVSGYDLPGNWTRFCAGDPAEPMPGRFARRGALLRYLHAGVGRIASVSGIEEARGMPGVLSCGAFVGPGDRSVPLAKDGDRSGWLIASGNDLRGAEECARAAASRIRFDLEPSGPGESDQAARRAERR